MRIIATGLLLYTMAQTAPAAAASFTMLHNFTRATGGYTNGGLLIGADGNIYGTAASGGAVGFGTIFKVGTDGGNFTRLYSFAAGAGGDRPQAGLIGGTDGRLYGTTDSGGSPDNLGTVFRIDTDGSDYEVLHTFIFRAGDGGNSSGRLIIGADGYFYGTTQHGGSADLGALFRLRADGSDYRLLHSFRGSNGAYPYAGLVADANGNFYGTTRSGGATVDGTVFRLDAAGNFTTLHHFDAADGTLPSAELILGMDGNLYGTTDAGGAGDNGTIFRIGVDGGDFEVLHAFSGADGARAFNAGLIADAAGNLFGTTVAGGADDMGTVFRLGADGSFELLHSFSGSDGTLPVGGLVVDADGNLYGNTFQGGATDRGVLFRLSDTGFVLRAPPGAVPEPASWAMMIAGIALAGGLLRRTPAVRVAFN